MATPTNDSYSAASAAIVHGGRTGPYTWQSSLINDAFVTIPGGSAFSTWATANIPAGAYQGTSPMTAMLDAYCDPAYDPGTGKQYIFGGGHGDGTCNAVTQFDHVSLGYTLIGQATPPSKYPPQYVPATGTFRKTIYPSGASGEGGVIDSSTTPLTRSGGHFRDNLIDPADTAYNTPRARASSHMYAANAIRNGVIHYFYQQYAEFNIASGTWANLGDNPNNFTLYPQLVAIKTGYGSVELQQGTVAVYDSVTDRFFVTLIPGDAGGSYRTSMIIFNPNGRLVESVIDLGDASYWFLTPSVTMTKVGRKLYVFTKSYLVVAYPNARMNQGFIMDMDTHALTYFSLVGDVAGSDFTENASQETIPCYYDGIAIRRWNYSTAQIGQIYSVNLTPESGVGTPASPFILRQTGRTITGAIPATTTYIYHRLVWNAQAGCAILLPRANAAPIALKLS